MSKTQSSKSQKHDPELYMPNFLLADKTETPQKPPFNKEKKFLTSLPFAPMVL